MENYFAKFIQKLTLCAVVVLLFPFGCVHFVKVRSAKQRYDYVKQIQSYDQAIWQIKASLRISASTFWSESPKEEADIILQSPYNIYWSLRSFFGPPNMVFASNGQYFTMYDFLGQNSESYHKFAISSDSIFEMLDFCFHPESLVALMMAKVPIDEDLEISAFNDQILLVSHNNKGFISRALFDIKQDRLVETTIANAQLGLSYHAKYNDYDASKIGFPMSLVLTARYKTKSVRLIVTYTAVEINGDKVEPSIFYLDK
jgi:hypothetical protein